jgi:hypothetical protein
VAVFEHVEGARVGEGLFEAYSLPNGRQAFMYYTAGPLVDEVEVGAPSPAAPAAQLLAAAADCLMRRMQRQAACMCAPSGQRRARVTAGMAFDSCC